MNAPAPILIAKAEAPLYLLPRFANRHGLIAGATGTGKTVTLQSLTEGFSAIGTPVFLADIKGDLSGLCQAGAAEPKIVERLRTMGLPEDEFSANPTLFWDVFGEQGHPIRTTISDVGPLLLARLLELNEIQSGVLNLVFRVADDRGLLLLDLKDLRAMLSHVAENAKALNTEYGSVSAASVGAIQRALLTLESQGGTAFFGEPALELSDLMRTDTDGRGCVNVLAADKLMQSPRLYATFLTWLLAELFEQLPEAGDLDKPKFILFFDEAHLLFDDAPEPLVDKIEQVVRLIRSKGVGVYFVTQNPLDIPEAVLGQLGNRIQHALRAFTPRDQKAVRTAADTFRPNPKLDTERVITELAVGEALVSLLDEKGTPTPVERALVRPPRSRLGPAAPEQKQAALAASPVGQRYNQALDRESAYEKLQAREKATAAAGPKSSPKSSPWADMGRQESDSAPAEPKRRSRTTRTRRAPQSVTEKFFGSAARSIGYELGRQITRGVLGSILRRR